MVVGARGWTSSRPNLGFLHANCDFLTLHSKKTHCVWEEWKWVDMSMKWAHLWKIFIDEWRMKFDFLRIFFSSNDQKKKASWLDANWALTMYTSCHTNRPNQRQAVRTVMTTPTPTRSIGTFRGRPATHVTRTVPTGGGRHCRRENFQASVVGRDEGSRTLW
jgi:hypothetical protein